MAKPEVKKPEEIQRIFLAYKGDAGGEYTRGFVIEEMDISKDVLAKHGKSISKTEPEEFKYLEGQMIRKLRVVLDV